MNLSRNNYTTKVGMILLVLETITHKLQEA